MRILIFGKEIKLKPLIPCLGIFMVLLSLRDFIGLEVPAILFLILTFFVAAFAEKTEVVTFCFCCIPVLNAFQSKYALLICMALYLIRFAKITIVPFQLVLIALLAMWEISHGSTGEFSLIEVFRLFTELFFCCFIMSLSPESINFKRIVRSMSVVAVCAYSILLLSQLQQHGFQIASLFSSAFRLGYGVDETKMSIGFNPNYLAYICLCCIEGIVLLIYKKQGKFIDLVCLFALSVFGALTMSKKFFLCVAVLVFLICLNRKRKIKSLLLIGVIAVVGVFVFYKLFPMAVDTILTRFRVDDILTGRSEIFAFFNQKLSNDMHLLFYGVGLQGYESKLLTRYNFSIPHNGFQELLVMWGLPGLVMFVAFLFSVIYRAKKLNRKIRFVNYIPFIIMMVNVQVSQMVSSSVVSILLAFVYICLITDMNIGEIKKRSVFEGVNNVN